MSVASGLLTQGYPFHSAKEQPFMADCPQHTGKIMPLEKAKGKKSSCPPSFHLWVLMFWSRVSITERRVHNCLKITKKPVKKVRGMFRKETSVTLSQGLQPNFYYILARTGGDF